MGRMATREYDLIVIGAGPVGENVADRAKQGGLSVVIVESELVGGECSYWACMPSKTLLRSGAALRAARDVDGARQAVTGSVDVAAALRRRDAIVHEWNDTSQVDWLHEAGIDLVRGHGRLTGERQVTVESMDGGEPVTLVARHAVAVSTGSAALLPDIPGLKDAAPWTSRDATGVRNVPASLAILGGGVVGSEMATLYASFGCAVTLIARSGLLGSMEPFAGEAVVAALREAGAEVRTGVEVDAVSREAGGDVVLALSDGTEVRAAEVLVATGRVPRTGDLGLESDRAGARIVARRGRHPPRPRRRLAVRGRRRQPPCSPHASGQVPGTRRRRRHRGPGARKRRRRRAVGRARRHRRSLGRPPGDLHRSRGGVGRPHRGDRPGGGDRHPRRRLRPVVGVGSEHARRPLQGSGPGDLRRGAPRAGRRDVRRARHRGAAALRDHRVVGEVPIDRLWHAVPAYPTVSEVWLRWLEEIGR